QRGLQDHQREVLAGAGLRAAAKGAPDVGRDRLAVEVVRIEAAGIGEEVFAHGEGRVADGEPGALGEEIATERKRLLHPPQRAVEVGGAPARTFPAPTTESSSRRSRASTSGFARSSPRVQVSELPVISWPWKRWSRISGT